MPEETPIPEVWVGSCTGTGEQNFIQDWCRHRPTWGVRGAAAAVVLAEPALWSGGRTPVCRFRHNSHPNETAGWLFHDGCVIHTLPDTAKGISVLNTDAFVPTVLQPQEPACEALYKQAVSFLRAAALLFHHTANKSLPLIHRDRVERYATRLALRERGTTGKGVYRCFLSRLSPEGYSTDHTLLTALCPRIYVIEDEAFAVGHRLTGALYRRLAASGQTLLVGICPVTGAVDHLMLPDTGVGITLSNRWHTVDFPVYHRIHAGRFCRGEGLRHSFCLQGVDELLKEAVRCLQEAKQISRPREDEIARTVDRELLFKSIRFWE